jgi:ABC-type multidrug transport system permease subunit
MSNGFASTTRNVVSSFSRTDRPLVQLTLARMREFIREPEAVFWTIGFPIVVSLALALAFPSRVDRAVRVGLYPEAAADSLRSTLQGTRGITIRDVRPEDERRALREGDVNIVVVPTTPPTYRFDPAREESRLARAVVDEALQRAGGRVDPWTAHEEPQEVAGSRYIDWFIPGLIGMGIMSNGMWGIGFGIVQARMRKLLKRMVASPMRRSEYLLAQLFARMVFLPAEVLVPLVFAVVAFAMPINGGALTIAIVALIGALSFGAIGLLLATRARTLEAISGLMNLVMLPMWIVSGVFFSSSNFPAVVQPVIHALPLTALIDALRAVILDGSSLADVRSELAVLIAWGVVPFFTALRLFSWK